ncbi:Hpt domain-containing protein [Parafilimonas sp.]|uniref:Hpt domain-containing protein n=1 Tax=Parafilimonas sp. TaxID=1969739 RepID=UPI0039E6DD95
MPDVEKLYDTALLIRTHNADEEFVKFMASLFVQHMPESNAGLEKACAESNWEKVYFFAHKMKASIDLFNLEPVKDLIRKVEQRALKFTQTDLIRKDVTFISGYIGQCIAAMKMEFELE